MAMDPSFVLNGDQDIDWGRFWYSETTRAWFLQRGYRLFNEDDVSTNETSFNKNLGPVQGLHQTTYPYPYHSQELDTETLVSRLLNFPAAVAFGQDSMRRPITVKFIRGGSEEYKCLRFINSLDLSQTLESCILPVLELLQYEDHWFVIMPQWSGDPLPVLNCERLKDALEMMHSMLKAVSFLHSHKIFHRDIKLGNFVFNFLPADEGRPYYCDKTYKTLQSHKRLLYAVIDFGLSITFAKNSSPQQCRLPYWESWCGAYSVPADCRQGEFDFDPFAFDVGVLGCVFADSFQHLTPVAPMIAPLIDKMVTRNIRNRFTASQALQFFEEMRLALPEQQLLTIIATPFPGPITDHYEVYDRWAGLPSEFIEEWSKYREPPLPYSTKILRYVCLFHPWIYRSVAKIRKILHSMTI